MRPWASVVRMPSPSESSASCERAGGRLPSPVPARQHFLGGEQDELAAGRLDGGAGELEARDLAMRIRDLDLGERGPRHRRARARPRAPRARHIRARRVPRGSCRPACRPERRTARRRLVYGLDALAMQQCGLAQRREHRARGVLARPLRAARTARPAGAPVRAADAMRPTRAQQRESPAPGRRSSGPSSGLSSPSIRGPRNRQFR